MGLVFDSGVLIAAERASKPISELLAELEETHDEAEIIISAGYAIGTRNERHFKMIPDLKVISL
jgi:hypothetical protein